uniref:Basic proline-rich protein-like n=1 Tax=Tursiops truncatus TaxID=9739 RepID=A0A6J3RBB4_TURTR|nr:basic proline-rich protein-like [Tursiops truncatus]
MNYINGITLTALKVEEKSPSLGSDTLHFNSMHQPQRPLPREGKDKYRRAGLDPGVLRGSGARSLFLPTFPGPGSASTELGGARVRGGELRPAPPRTPGAAGAAQREAPGARGRGDRRAGRDSGPRPPPAPARLRGHPEAAPRPRTGTDAPVSRGPTPQLGGPAARAPRVPGEIRTQQERRNFPGNHPPDTISSSHRAHPAVCVRSRRPRRRPRRPDAPEALPANANAAAGRASRPFPAARAAAPPSPPAAAATHPRPPRLRARGSGRLTPRRRPAAPSSLGAPASSCLRPALPSAAADARPRAGVRAWGRVVPPPRPPPPPPSPPPPPPEFGALLQCLRG